MGKCSYRATKASMPFFGLTEIEDTQESYPQAKTPTTQVLIHFHRIKTSIYRALIHLNIFTFKFCALTTLIS